MGNYRDGANASTPDPLRRPPFANAIPSTVSAVAPGVMAPLVAYSLA